MIYGSVCSGIEAASVAWLPLGWDAAWFSEIEPFPCAVLAHHYPDVPNLGDMTRIHDDDRFRRSPIDLLVGGTPCQSFSVAGLRKGLADPRGNLALVFLALLDRKRPQWVVWENVPGVLSSWSDASERPATADDYATAGQADPGDGRRGRVVEQTSDFDTFLCGLRELGYHGAWRVLDAQFFGVPQRRRRVFVVGHLGDGAPARAVLFERHSLSGHPPPSRKAGQGFAAPTAPSLTASGRGVERTGKSRGQDPVVAHALRGEGFDASEDGTGRGTPIIAAHETGQGYWQQSDQAGTLRAEGENRPSRPSNIVAFKESQSGTRVGDAHKGSRRMQGVIENGGGGRSSIVRRLTPRECARLQGFPDDYLDIVYHGKPAADGPKYRALGNSMCVNVMAWIGRRIQMVEELL